MPLLRFYGWVGACMLAACVHSDAPDGTVLHPAPGNDWTPAVPSPDARREADTWRFECPFPDGADRHAWDMDLATDLHAYDGLEIHYTLENPDAFRGLTWYLRSESGWHAAALPVRDGVQRAWLPWARFEPPVEQTRGTEASGFRLSPWASGRGSGTVLLHEVRARNASIGVVYPGPLSSPDGPERDFGRRQADRWMADLAHLSLPATPVEEEALSSLDARQTRVLVLPYNPRPEPDMRDAIARYIQSGGFVVVCYNADPDIAAHVGVKPGRWVSAGEPGQWHRIVFPADGWSGPDTVYQPHTPHLIPVAPAAPDAYILASWEDARGEQRPEAAVAASPRGVWFSYLLGNDDEEARLHMLAFLLEPALPEAPMKAARRRLEDAEHRTGVPFDAFLASLPDDAEPAALRDRARQALSEGRAADAWRESQALMQTLDREQAATIPRPDGLALGIWDHSGHGLYPGDWPRTLAELAAAGFTDLFVFCSRNAPLPARIERAVRAAEPHGIRIHAWHIGLMLHDIGARQRRDFEQEQRLQQSAAGDTAPWLCPSRPENRALEKKRLLRIAAVPGLHGIHLDYFRYPDPDHCFCPACRAAFEESIGEPVADWPQAVRDGGPLQGPFHAWRAEGISRLVQGISAAVREANPDIQRSAAVWPNADRVKIALGQDWPHWLEKGWFDFLVPMSYTENIGEFRAWTAAHSALPGAETRIWAGIGATTSHSRLAPVHVLRQIDEGLRAGASGAVVFDLNPTVRAALFPVLQTWSKKGVGHD